LGTNLVGVRIGKWTENLGGAAAWVLAGLLVAAAALVAAKRGPATEMDLIPVWHWSTVSLWASIAYAMSGLELAGLMGGEIRDPERTLPRAGWIASAFATVFYLSTTWALLVLLRPDQVSELNGLSQAGDQAAGALGAGWISPSIALLVLVAAVGQIGGFGTAVSRLPFAAGVDRLLPAAFARIHPRWHTPHVSILALGGVASMLLIGMQLGDTMRAAYQALVSLMVIVGFLPYFYVFGSAWKASRRLSAVSGGVISAVAVLVSLVPTAEVDNVWLFEGKLLLGTALVIASARLVYRRALGEAGRQS
jgi:amino acid transporter